MERVVRKFATFEEAEAAEREYYRQLSGDQRIAIMLDLIFPEGTDAASQRLERVYRVVKLGAS